MENVDHVEITWDNDYLRLSFTDIFGEGTQYVFSPEEMEKVRDQITEALLRYREGY